MSEYSDEQAAAILIREFLPTYNGLRKTSYSTVQSVASDSRLEEGVDYWVHGDDGTRLAIQHVTAQHLQQGTLRKGSWASKVGHAIRMEATDNQVLNGAHILVLDIRGRPLTRPRDLHNFARELVQAIAYSWRTKGPGKRVLDLHSRTVVAELRSAGRASQRCTISGPVVYSVVPKDVDRFEAALGHKIQHYSALPSRPVLLVTFDQVGFDQDQIPAFSRIAFEHSERLWDRFSEVWVLSPREPRSRPRCVWSGLGRGVGRNQ